MPGDGTGAERRVEVRSGLGGCNNRELHARDGELAERFGGGGHFIEPSDPGLVCIDICSMHRLCEGVMLMCLGSVGAG
jgi:hypothetical protein